MPDIFEEILKEYDLIDNNNNIINNDINNIKENIKNFLKRKSVIEEKYFIGQGGFGVLIKLKKSHSTSSKKMKISEESEKLVEINPFSVCKIELSKESKSSDNSKKELLDELVNISGLDSYSSYLVKIYKSIYAFYDSMLGNIDLQIMEYIPGIDLYYHIFNENVMQITRNDNKNILIHSIYIIKQIIKGTKFLHKNNIIHLDLKLENIMIYVFNNKYLCKIIDLDCAIKLKDSLTNFKVVGTIDYIIPEQRINNLSEDYELNFDQYCNRDTFAIINIFSALIFNILIFSAANFIKLIHLLGPSLLTLPENSSYFNLLLENNLIENDIIEKFNSIKLEFPQIYDLLILIFSNGSNTDYEKRSKEFNLNFLFKIIIKIQTLLIMNIQNYMINCAENEINNQANIMLSKTLNKHSGGMSINSHKENNLIPRQITFKNKYEYNEQIAKIEEDIFNPIKNKKVAASKKKRKRKNKKQTIKLRKRKRKKKKEKEDK